MMTPNAGYNAGLKKAARIERLAWALKGAPLRKKDLRLSSFLAVAEARKLRDSITQKMRDLNPDDGIVQVVFAVPDIPNMKKLEARTVEVSAQKDAALAMEFSESLPIGFLVWVWDREKQEIYGHARPLIVEDERSLDLNSMALKASEKKLRLNLMADGVIRDDRN